ncbi:hypothetical protein P9112_012766 [Eukaryota sp. TZLM1-RC]
MAASFEQIGRAFVEHYYKVFDSDRSQLAALYRDDSMLTFEGKQHQGAANIIKHLTEGLSFQTVAHTIGSIDCQPSTANGVLILVTGNIVADGNAEMPLNFSQTFHLSNSGNQWFVTNDIFRLVF